MCDEEALEVEGAVARRIAASDLEAIMAPGPTCTSCQSCRAVSGPTPLGPAPYRWCGNFGSYHFADPVNDGFVCERHELRRTRIAP